MTSARESRRFNRSTRAQVDTALGALRVFVASAVASMGELDERVTLPQLRVLVMIATQGPQNIAAVAAGLMVNPSNASRTCDRLVRARLLNRQEKPADRRNMTLSLTLRGHELVDAITGYRRGAIEQVLGTMTAAQRRAVTAALGTFVQAASQLPRTQHAGTAVGPESVNRTHTGRAYTPPRHRHRPSSHQVAAPVGDRRACQG